MTVTDGQAAAVVTRTPARTPKNPTHGRHGRGPVAVVGVTDLAGVPSAATPSRGLHTLGRSVLRRPVSPSSAGPSGSPRPPGSVTAFPDEWTSVTASRLDSAVYRLLVLLCLLTIWNCFLRDRQSRYQAVQPHVETSVCVVHLLRNRFRYAACQAGDKVAEALKPVCTAPSEGAAMERFGEFQEAWAGSIRRSSVGRGTVWTWT